MWVGKDRLLRWVVIAICSLNIWANFDWGNPFGALPILWGMLLLVCLLIELKGE